MTLRMENVGQNKDLVYFYGVNTMNETAILRQRITCILNDRKNLENEVIKTWDVLDEGTTYVYSHTQEDGTLIFKNAIL